MFSGIKMKRIKSVAELGKTDRLKINVDPGF